MTNTKSVVIILGAGASYDYVQPIFRGGDFIPPPMTDHIFDKSYVDKIEKSFSYLRINDLISAVAPKIKLNNKSLEEFMSEYLDYDQRCEFQFLLRDLFGFISNKYYDKNNYSALKNYILKYNYEACIATFNYDTLLEQSLFENGKLKTISDYVRENIKVVKLHGSCDWSCVNRKSDIEDQYLGIKNDLEYLKAHSKMVTGFPICDFDDNFVRESKNFHSFPAIAIPTKESKDFICPKEHLEVLASFLQFTEKILIIGWKAGDKKFVDFLESNIQKKTSVAIVSGTKGDISQVKEQLRHIKNLDLDFMEKEGFSKFVEDDECDKFFGNS